MMAPLNTQEGPANTLVATFDLVLDLMKRKVVTNNKDLVGLVLFNTVPPFPSSFPLAWTNKG